MKHLKLFFACLLMAVLSIGQVWAGDVLDELTASDFAATSTTYTNFSGVTATSDAVYAGNSAKDASGNIQLRSKNSNSGIVSTTSGGVVKSVKITVGSGSNTIDVYGSNTAYTNATDLYNAQKQGTKVGSLTATGTVTFTDEYAYVGIRSNNGALYLSEVEITWTSAAPPTYTITAESNNTTYGTVSLSGSVITGSPKSGCRYASPAYTVTDGTATVSQSGDAFTVTPSTDCTVQINFEAIPSYTVTWNNNGATSTTQVLDGEKPVFPATPAACDATSTTFIGWATAPWTGKLANLDDKTVYTKAADMPAVNDAVTYYAVFAQVSGASGWNLTDIADLTSSDVFVLADASNYALNNDGGASNAPSANAITVSDGKITSEVADNLKWNVSGNATDGYTFYPNGTDESWLYCNTTASSSSNNCMRVGTGDRKVFEVNASGYLVTKDAYTARYLSRYDESSTPKDFRGYVNTNTNPVQPKCYKYSAGSASNYMTTCCTKYDISIADGITNGSISADLAKACEDAVVTITFSPAGGYHLESWSVNGTDQDVNENTFSMPAEDVEVSATFAHDACSNLDAPTLNGTIAVTYNSATINWNAAANASSYDVAVVRHSDSESIFSGNLNALTKALADLDPETQYDYSIMGVGDGATYCASGNGVLEGNFTTESLPTAHLTLIDPSGTHAESGDYAILTPFNLPTTAATCSKAFVGWDADADCAVAPTYAKGQSFTFLNTTDVTLYAVYADVTGGSTSTTDIKCTVSTTTNMTGGNDADLLVDETDAADAGWIVTGYKGGGSNYPGLNKDGTIRLYYNASGNSYIDVTAPSTITSIEVTCKSGNDNIIVKVGDNTISLEDGVYPINATSFEIVNGYASSTQVHIQNIAVNFTTSGTPSNYSTTCAAAPEAIVDPEEVNAPAAGVANGVIVAAYDNVNESAVAVALYNNAACTEAFTGSWLTASINDDKNIAYTIAENTSYNDARTAYIKLTAPETNGAASPAVVVIPVEQAKKPAVFASLAELVAAELASGTEVTVSFSNVMITEVYTTNAGYRYGLYLNVKDKDGENDIELFYNKQGDSEQVPDTWVKNGYVSATNLVTTWTEYKGQWELAMQGATWSWENGDITYGAPKAVSSVVVSGEPAKKAYVDGEKFNPAGLTVTVNYTVGDPDVIDAAGADWEFTPERLAKGETGISVKATYNTVQSAAFNVTGLTVGDIQLKTVEEFIAAGNADMRCYLEGIVSDIETGTKLKYGNFNLTDASGTIYVYGCLNQDGEAQKFDELGVQNGDKIKVIAEDYEFYSSKDEAKNVQFVSKISPVQITIADKVLEEGANWTIVATTDPEGALANISYDIKDDGSDAFVSLAGNVITANAQGTATIIASIPDGEGYLANSIEFEVEVVEAGSVANVVILVEYEGAWYAMKHNLSGVEVDYQPAIGKIYGMTDPVAQAEIVWSRSKTGTTYTFTYGDNYLKGGNKTDLSVGSGASGTYQWEKGAEETYYHCLTGRTFIYNGTAFKNYAVTNAGGAGYSSMPKVELSDDIFTSHTIYTRNVSGNYGTICLPKNGILTNGTLFEIAYYGQTSKKIFFDEIPNNEMVAGRPYLFKPNENVTELKVAYTDSEDPVAAGNYKGLHGFYNLADENATFDIEQDAGNYIMYSNQYWLVSGRAAYIENYRAYIVLSDITTIEPAKAPGVHRVAMNVNGEQVATGFENLNASEKPVKLMIDGNIYILRGEKLYDATGRLVK